MIDKVLLLIRDELSAYFKTKNITKDVVLENIGLLETTSADNLKDSVVITVVNIEEESTLKNGKNVHISGISNTAQYINRPVHLNLYVLFTANFPGGIPPNNAYIDGLSYLSYVILFFQGRNSFSVSTLAQPLAGIDDPATDPDLLKMKVTLELYTLTFEQVNHLWGSLGGRQIPFVMYKLRLVVLTERNLVREVPLIEEIETNLSPNISGN
jgi:hypothetical protein